MSTDRTSRRALVVNGTVSSSTKLAHQLGALDAFRALKDQSPAYEHFQDKLTLSPHSKQLRMTPNYDEVRYIPINSNLKEIEAVPYVSAAKSFSAPHAVAASSRHHFRDKTFFNTETHMYLDILFLSFTVVSNGIGVNVHFEKDVSSLFVVWDLIAIFAPPLLTAFAKPIPQAIHTPQQNFVPGAHKWCFPSF